MSTNFRLVLRQESQAQHERLDREISSLDLSIAGDYAQFLRLHHICFSELKRALEPESPLHDVLDTLLRLLEDDLQTLGLPSTRVETRGLDPVDPLSALYVVEGSRLGSQVLTRRWALAKDPRILKAGTYFAHKSPPNTWRQVCDSLASVPQTGARAQRVVCDTKRIFEMFTDVLATLKKNATKGTLASL